MNEEQQVRREFPRVLARGRGKRSMDKLGSEVGVTRQAIWKFEHGLCLPNVPTLVRLARALSCSVDRLLGLDKEE